MKPIFKCLFLIAICMLMGKPTEGDECHIPKCMEKNTLCIYPTDEKSSNCPPDFDDSITQTVRDVILDTHNKFRSDTAMGEIKDVNGKYFHSASNMVQLEWDDGLEHIAHRYIIQCIGKATLKHDACRSTEKFEKVGQNIGFNADSNVPEGDLHQTNIRNWQDEYKLYDCSKEFTKNHFHETGHFTALNWALTTHVGCATGLYKDEKLNYYHLYCDYGPAGNVAGNEMYLKGDPCTKCPEGTSCSKKYKGLCTGGKDAGADPPKPRHNEAHGCKPSTLTVFTHMVFSLIFSFFLKYLTN